MDELLVNHTVRQFSAELASGEPTPGGGAAAALAGALAAGLLAMVCRFTVGREKFAAVEAEVQQLLDEADAMRERFLEAVDTDAAAYAVVASAFRLPRATDEDKAARTSAIREASWRAAKPPLAVAEEAARLVGLCQRAEQITNPMLRADVTTAVALARSAILGGAANVEANISGLAPEQASVVEARLTAARAALTDA